VARQGLAEAGCKKGKRFFFEKKNQKTFPGCRALAGEAATAWQQLLLLFQKEALPFS
jgi:hypothetical protein